MGDGVAKRDVIHGQFAGVNMQTAAHFAGRDLGDAADRRDDSREHDRPCCAQKEHFITPN